MKTLIALSIIFMFSTAAHATKEYVISKSIPVYELNHAKGKVQCTLKKNTRVQSDWDRHKYSFIKTKKCKGWVESKYLKST